MSLDPGAKTVLDLAEAARRPPYETLGAAEARALYRAGRVVLQPEPREVGAVRDLTAPGPGGAIPLRLYRARGTKAETKLPLLVYYHGGGWVLGDIGTHDVVCRHLANAAGAAVLSVDYRLGPEHKFPAAVDDSFAALTYAVDAADDLGIDASRIAVGGDSAGGNLAAAVSLLARDRGGPRLALQLLIYPATDFAGSYPSQSKFADGYLLTAANQAWFHRQYLRDEADAADWRASPIRAPSLRGVAPAWVLTAGYDPLCDEGEAYAKRLAAEGVAVTTRRFDDQIHGFITMGRMIPAADLALDEAGAAVKAAFGRA
jgi:acetyl esterase